MSKICKKCGNQLKDTSKFCSKCGTPYVEAPDVQSNPSVTNQPQQQATIPTNTPASSVPSDEVQNKETGGGCLSKILKWGIILVVVIVALSMFFGDNSSEKKTAGSNKTVVTENAKNKETVSASAEKALKDFHYAITSKDYHTAYNILAPDMQKYVGGYDKFVKGYSTTVSSTVIDLQVLSSGNSSAVIEYLLEAKDKFKAGTLVQQFKGKAILQNIGGTWKITEVTAKKIGEKLIE